MSLLFWAQAGLKKAASSQPAPDFEFTRALNRTFSGHPTWGGGNVSDPFNFVYNGTRFRIYQVIPFGGPAIGAVYGCCRIHIRNLDKNRGQNTLEEMPAKLVLSDADWTGLPWSFTRTTQASQFTNAGSGGSARKQLTYLADRVLAAGLTPAGLGIAQGESFKVSIFF